MNKEEAKRILQGKGEKDLDVSAVTEALVFTETDPELKTWWQTQQVFDQQIAAKLAEVPIPARLRETVLAGDKIKSFKPAPAFPYWLAAAAVLILLAMAGWPSWTNESRLAVHLMPQQEYNASLLLSVDHDPKLAMKSGDHQQLLDWLKTQGSPVGAIPTSLNTIASVGCTTMNMEGHAVSLICFSLPNGNLAHLFIVDQRALASPPPLAHPEFAQHGSWAMASWSDGNKSYVLASRADMSTLQHLL